MPVYAIAEKRPNMSFFAIGTPLESSNVNDYKNIPEVAQKINSIEIFGDKWKIMEIVPNPALPNKMVDKGNSER